MKKIIHQFTETGEVRVPKNEDGQYEWFFVKDYEIVQQYSVNGSLAYQQEYPILTYEKIIEDVLTPDEISDRICELEQYATRRYLDAIEFKYILETLNDDDKIEYDRLQEQLKNLQTKE